LSASATSEQHKHGQLGVVFDDSPKIFYQRRGHLYSGICPVPYFASSLVLGKEFEGKLHHIPEPLKVRSITTEGAWEFAAFKPLQHVIFSRMKRHPNVLSGRDVREEDIEDLIGRSKEYYGEGEELVFVSGDYEAATDNLSPKLSRLVDHMMIERLGLNLVVPACRDVAMGIWHSMSKVYEYVLGEAVNDLGPNTTRKWWVVINEIFKKMLEQSTIQKTDIQTIRGGLWSGRSITSPVTKESGVQYNGQMMGDIKSFPVLTLINLSLWEYVNQCESKWFRSVSEDWVGVTSKSRKVRAPCLVNGDDFLAFCPRWIIDKWFAACSEFGLKASIGKTHVSSSVAQINSTNFRRHGSKVKKVTALPIHVSLEIPRNKPAEQSINYAIKANESLFNRILFHNKRRIKEITGGGLINLCMPKWMGGLGVDLVPKKITGRQRLIAWNNYLSERKPVEIGYNWASWHFRDPSGFKHTEEVAMYPFLCLT
jgi:hypothetical protein